MIVAKINAYKEVLKEHLRITQDYNELYKYEALKNFQEQWDLSALDLKKVYDQSFQSPTSGRLWGGSTNSAKEYMLKFIDKDKEFVRSMFRDLYNEEKDVGMRVNRFLLHCDELLRQLQIKELKLNNHLHGPEEASLYLAFKYPDRYCLFNYGPFNIMMNRLEAKNVPQEFEVDRYFKLCKGLFTILSKDEEVMELYKKHLVGENYHQELSMLMVHDYLLICSQNPPI